MRGGGEWSVSLFHVSDTQTVDPPERVGMTVVQATKEMSLPADSAQGCNGFVDYIVLCLYSNFRFPPHTQISSKLK